MSNANFRRLILRGSPSLPVITTLRVGLTLGILVVLASASLPAQQAAQTAPPAASISPDTVLRGEAAQIAATVRALFAAAERNDLDQLAALYAGDSLTIVEGAGINRGWTDYRDHHLAPEMKEMKNFRYRPFEIQARAAGDMGWAIFRYALSADVNGKPVDVVGRGTAILQRQGSKWIVRHTQTTSRPRRPADPPLPQ